MRKNSTIILVRNQRHFKNGFSAVFVLLFSYEEILADNKKCTSL
ncbi:hypothetical protein J2Z44_002159 [Clostridium punense]|uniref:Uncharacterized protein n=1 Tax=Clostridium punense TaxID=1054297 RepID=A0ABS4K3J5_9CLOT|nr:MULTISPECIES: hypothetical protein [Clostridium]MBP2022338.1 hypothetical protein [Clostridium punense]